MRSPGRRGLTLRARRVEVVGYYALASGGVALA